MFRVKPILIITFLLLIPVAIAQAPTESATARELTAMVGQFLRDAGRGNPAGFDSFFADDVIYTRSTGMVVTKADIMRNLGNSRPVLESSTTYSAEDVTVHEYGDTAVVAFRLVAHTENSAGKPPSTANYRNTGTFLKRNARWQVVAWQSTIIPNAPAAQ
jgi:ketosteroid isomerase-like protein